MAASRVAHGPSAGSGGLGQRRPEPAHGGLGEHHQLGPVLSGGSPTVLGDQVQVGLRVGPGEDLGQSGPSVSSWFIIVQTRTSAGERPVEPQLGATGQPQGIAVVQEADGLDLDLSGGQNTCACGAGRHQPADPGHQPGDPQGRPASPR